MNGADMWKKWSNAIPDSVRTDYHEVKRAIEDFKFRNILDIGCGNGAFVRLLNNDEHVLYGIDASSNATEVANGELPGHFFVCDIDEGILPSEVSKKKFDAILSTQTIEHLYSPKRFMEFTSGILDRGGGGLIITTPYHGYFKYLVLALFGKMDKHLEPEREGGHIKFWSRRSLTDLIEANGFSVLRFRGMGRFPFLWKSMMLVAVKK